MYCVELAILMLWIVLSLANPFCEDRDCIATACIIKARSSNPLSPSLRMRPAISRRQEGHIRCQLLTALVTISCHQSFYISSDFVTSLDIKFQESLLHQESKAETNPSQFEILDTIFS